MEETRKEEILARSKRENRNGDERERTIRIQGESFSLIFILLMSAPNAVPLAANVSLLGMR